MGNYVQAVSTVILHEARKHPDWEPDIQNTGGGRKAIH